MGVLFGTSGVQSAAVKNRPSDDLLHRLGCRACSLNKADLDSPKMLPSGAAEPWVYCLGGAPSRYDDSEGLQFSGPPGDFLRSYFPGRLRQHIRWSNVLNCWTGEGSPDPTKMQLECCRPRIIADIEHTQPDAIFGFGPFPLSWSDKTSGIDMWRGRRFPLRIGSHVCWYYAFRDPEFVLGLRRNGRKSDEEIAFDFDIKRAIAEIEAGLPAPVVHSADFARQDITCISGRHGKDLKYLLDFLEYAGGCDVAGVDYETQNLRPYSRGSLILTRAVSVADETVAFGWQHAEVNWTADQFKQLEDAWVRFLRSPAKKAVHNLSFEMEWDCHLYGRELARSVPWEDTQTQAYVLDERVGEHKPGALALEFISLQHFGINIKKLTPGLNKQRMADEPLDKLLPYNAIDAKYHRLNYKVLAERIYRDGLDDTYHEKLRQVSTVVLTQIKGVPTDPKETLKLEREYAAKLADVVARIQDLPEAKQFRRLTNQPFNPGSPQDVVVMLRDILKTREGQEGVGWSTKESVISKLKHPLTDGVLEYRGFQKMKSTYIDKLMPGGPDSDLYDDGLLHTNLGTCFTDTGRLQSDGPNIQNFPNRNKEERRIRRQIRAVVVASLDAGQIDARMIACGSRDKTYCKALWEDYDIHMEWARRLALHHPAFVGGKKFVNDLDVMKNFRSSLVKNAWVFALFYGAALRTTAGRFGVDEDTLRPLYERFWKEFEGVKAWQDKMIRQFEDTGYVQMLGGQRRRAPLGRGQVVNSPIQNATNRIVMHGMNRLSETGIWALQPNMQIHDDLTLLFNSEREYEDNIERIVELMLDCREFDWICVPLTVELKEGPSWADQKEVATFSSSKRLGWPVRTREFQ